MLNALLLAVLVGKKEVPRYVMANIVGSLLSIAFVFLFCNAMGVVRGSNCIGELSVGCIFYHIDNLLEFEMV